MKRSQPRRDWIQAHEKVSNEGGRCRVCRTFQDVQRAHVIGRTHDFDFPLRAEGDWKPGTVHPDRIVPLCQHHHTEFDAHRFDLLPWLTLYETLQAVADSASGRENGLEKARRRLAPSAYLRVAA